MGIRQGMILIQITIQGWINKGLRVFRVKAHLMFLTNVVAWSSMILALRIRAGTCGFLSKWRRLMLGLMELLFLGF